MTTPRRARERLAARYSTRQLEALAHADALGDATDRAVDQWWARLVRFLRDGKQRPFFDRQTFRQVLASLYPILHTTLAGGLNYLARWGHDSAVDPLAHYLPHQFLQVELVASLREDKESFVPRIQVPSLPEPAEKMSKAELWAAFKAFTFPPPSEKEVAAIVYAGDWQQRIASLSRLAQPDVLANSIVEGYSQGENVQQLAARLAPALNDVKTSARRVARTDGMRVAHTSQMNAWDKLGDKLTGYQVHATLDSVTRPWHAARSGQLYFKNPEPGQKGLRQMPRPPQEAEDPNERPAGTPRTAFNCRCFVVPILQSAKRITDDAEKEAVFTTAENKLVPDPAVYSDWFDRAPERLQKLAVGVQRYNDMAEKDPALTWSHFLDPTGDLVPAKTLKRETPEERQRRVAEVNRIIEQRRQSAREASMFGFLRPKFLEWLTQVNGLARAG